MLPPLRFWLTLFASRRTATILQTVTVHNTDTVTSTEKVGVTAIFTKVDGATVVMTLPPLRTATVPAATITSVTTPPAQGGAAYCSGLAFGNGLIYDYITVNYDYTQRRYATATTSGNDCCAMCQNTENCVNYSYNFNGNGVCLLNIATTNRNANGPNAKCPNGSQNVQPLDAGLNPHRIGLGPCGRPGTPVGLKIRRAQPYRL